MKVMLTNKVNAQKIVVEMDRVELMEPDADGTSTHIVFGADLVRVVTESIAQITSAIGVTKVS